MRKLFAQRRFPKLINRPVTGPRLRASRRLLFLVAGLIGFASLAMGCMGRSVGGSQGEEYDLRQLHWGMDQAQLRDAEHARLAYEDSHLLVYGTTILDRQMALEYHLGSNQFYRAVYRLAENYLMEAKYLKDYNDFKTVLGKKFGPSLKDEMKWHKPHLQGDPSQWGVAVSIGDLACQTVWETPRTRITLALTGGNHQIECTIEYLSKELEHLAHAQDGQSEAPQQSGRTDKRLKKALEDF